MKNAKYVNFAVFLLFFGVALFESIQNQNWWSAILFFVLGLLSLLMDFRGFSSKKER